MLENRTVRSNSSSWMRCGSANRGNPALRSASNCAWSTNCSPIGIQRLLEERAAVLATTLKAVDKTSKLGETIRAQPHLRARIVYKPVLSLLDNITMNSPTADLTLVDSHSAGRKPSCHHGFPNAAQLLVARNWWPQSKGYRSKAIVLNNLIAASLPIKRLGTQWVGNLSDQTS